ncbi:hypothetical protein [Moritella marina]|uniref:hypothetical protein n=1 Tax=Moritella marina TaxID=90736 RepID=UPI0037039433
MNDSSKESLDKAKEEVMQALEKLKKITNIPHLKNDQSRHIKQLIKDTKMLINIDDS